MGDENVTRCFLKFIVNDEAVSRSRRRSDAASEVNCYFRKHEIVPVILQLQLPWCLFYVETEIYSSLCIQSIC
jgi:hypothetical protein